ncbi:MAG: MBL fold metallo-hydrolase [Phycisphaerales bacterium]|nr:MBL fold metallo-hydrolase [Phycisphaerales bacterium]
MPPEYSVISLGTLSAHPLWNESSPVRTPHATTTLIVAEDHRILVNPSLPLPVLQARMSERTPVRPEEITHVFMTSLAGDHRRGLEGFPSARWLAFDTELSHEAERLRSEMEDATAHDDQETAELISAMSAALDRVEPAGDQLAPGVDLFPLPGLTPGTCGLLISQPRATVLVSGDAVATREHLERGQVLPRCADLEQAQESFREAIEIADVIIPGRDNLLHR